MNTILSKIYIQAIKEKDYDTIIKIVKKLNKGLFPFGGYTYELLHEHLIYNKDSFQIIDKLLLYINEMNWILISRDFILSEEIMDKYQDYLDWYIISRHQTFSNDFIIKFKDKLNIEYIIIHRAELISDETIIKLADEIKWECLDYLNATDSVHQRLMKFPQYINY